MYKKILAIMSSLSMMFFMAFPAFAQQTELGYDLVEDEADILSDEEESELLLSLEEIQQEQNVDVIVVTVSELGDRTATEYADDYFDYNGYGQNESKDGILFLISMTERKWAISTHGEAIGYFTDAGQEYMTDQFMSYISDGDYAQGFVKYAELCKDFIIQAQNGEPYDSGNLPKHLSFTTVLIEIGVCFGIAAIYCFYEKSKLKTIRENNAAMDYVREGSMQLHIRQDRFTHQTVTSRVIQKESSGSSTHTSSSGESHGGSSGDF